MTEREGVAAVERALAILGAFRAEEEPLALAELAERTGLYKSTILRLLVSLERHAYVVRLAEGRYRLGPALLRLGSLYQRSFRLEDHVVPVLRRIAQESGETVSFYTRDGEARVCLFRVDSSHNIRHHVQIGEVLPLQGGATGRVLVAFVQGAQHGGSDALTLPIVAHGEHDPDIAAMSVPVFGDGGRLVGAMTVSGPRKRFTRPTIAKLSPLLLEAAAELSAELGGASPLYGQRRLRG